MSPEHPPEKFAAIPAIEYNYDLSKYPMHSYASSVPRSKPKLPPLDTYMTVIPLEDDQWKPSFSDGTMMGYDDVSQLLTTQPQCEHLLRNAITYRWSTSTLTQSPVNQEEGRTLGVKFWEEDDRDASVSSPSSIPKFIEFYKKE